MCTLYHVTFIWCTPCHHHHQQFVYGMCLGKWFGFSHGENCQTSIDKRNNGGFLSYQHYQSQSIVWDNCIYSNQKQFSTLIGMQCIYVSLSSAVVSLCSYYLNFFLFRSIDFNFLISKSVSTNIVFKCQLSLTFLLIFSFQVCIWDNLPIKMLKKTLGIRL